MPRTYDVAFIPDYLWDRVTVIPSTETAEGSGVGTGVAPDDAGAYRAVAGAVLDGTLTVVGTPFEAYTFESGGYIEQITNGTISGSKFALIGITFRTPASLGSAQNIFQLLTSGSLGRVTIFYQTTNRLGCNIANSAGTNICAFNSRNNVLATSTWYTLVIAVDTTQSTDATRMRVWIKPDGGSWEDLSATPTTLTTTLDGIIDNCARIRFFGPASDTAWVDIFATLSETLDISTESNRNKLLPGADKGANGSVVTGTQPPVFFDFRGDPLALHVNKGNGGALQGLFGKMVKTTPPVGV
jgi:hypothetical protein